ncbi:MAG: tRNA (adenosine(37)-N6)-dimethylallyltransferase MiaA [bacterium]|nr:tRNA (adenosine(37)-N6)-dimethylallyltransferase MiaA [bacterium]
MKKLLVICGLTATGKTGLAIKLAKILDGEIVSADSRQVYRGMDIGTGKDLPVNSKIQIPKSKSMTKFPAFGRDPASAVTNDKSRLNPRFYRGNRDKFQIGYYLMDGIRVWMLDVVEPMYRFNVADYLSCAVPVIDDIRKREKLPIIVGGTGLYIKGLLDGIETVGVPPDWEVREKLSHCSIASLSQQLQKLDPERLKGMNESDRKNPRRLVRAIEIAVKTKNKKLKNKNDKEKLKNDDILMVALAAPIEIIRERIRARLLKRFEEGMVREVRDLCENGVSWERLEELGLEYRWIGRYLQGKIDYPQMVDSLFRDIVGFAKRQKTWFKKDKRVSWFDISAKDWREEVEKSVRAWYD